MAESAQTSRLARVGLLAGLALLILAPFIGLYPVFVMTALCYAIFACAFNLLLGYTGLLSFGHAAYFASAAYATGWLVRSAGLSPELGVLAGVVIGGMGSILGSILTGLALGLIEGLTKVFYPEASNIVVFVIMAIVLMVRPAGLFGKEK